MASHFTELSHFYRNIANISLLRAEVSSSSSRRQLGDQPDQSAYNASTILDASLFFYGLIKRYDAVILYISLRKVPVSIHGCAIVTRLFLGLSPIKYQDNYLKRAVKEERYFSCKGYTESNK
jgi:hypothetical protein